MIALQDSRPDGALAILDTCFDRPPNSPLLPLLALSVLSSQVPFSGTRVGALAVRMAEEFAAADNGGAADEVLDACAAGLQRCGVLEVAADLREAQALLRLRAMTHR